VSAAFDEASDNGTAATSTQQQSIPFSAAYWASKSRYFSLLLLLVLAIPALIGSIWKVTSIVIISSSSSSSEVIAPRTSMYTLNNSEILLIKGVHNNHIQESIHMNISKRRNDHSYYLYRRTQINRALRELQKSIDGTIYFVSDNDNNTTTTTSTNFSQAVHVWSERSVTADRIPWAVIEVHSEADVQKVVPVLAELKRIFDFPFRVRSGGHNKAGYSTVSNGAVISLSRLNQIEIYPQQYHNNNNNENNNKSISIANHHEKSSDAIARIGPAVLVEQFVDHILRTHGYGGVIGFCGTVAEGGFVLGGGIGLQSRLYGLGLDNVAGLRIVLADGSVHYVSNDAADDEQMKQSYITLKKDIFWALRGAGGGNFGVVTQIDYHIHKANDKWLYYAMTLQEPSDTASFLYRLGAIEAELPGNVLVMHDFANGVRIMWSGRDETALDGSDDYLDDLIDQLVPDNAPRSIQKIEVIWSEMYTANSLLAIKTPRTWAASCWYGFMMPQNNTEAIWRDIIHLISEKSKEMTPFLLPDIELWGGAIHNTPSNATAFPHRSAVYNVGVLLTIPADTTNAEQVFQDCVAKVNIWWPRIAEYLTGSYVNYPMTSIENLDYPRMYWGNNLERLVEIKRRVDPDDIFSFPLSVPTSLK